MMGSKERHFAPLINVSLEELVPADHFYRHLERALDLTFVREFVHETYAGGGRSSIDPVVFFKLQLVMFFEGIRSERQLMRHAADRLSVRWYVGYDLDVPVSLSQEEREALAQDNAERHDWIEQLGAQDRSVTTRGYQRITDLRVSTTYPDATVMLHKDGSHLGYQTHYVVDGGKSRIILDVLVTPAEVMENQPMLDLIWRERCACYQMNRREGELP